MRIAFEMSGGYGGVFVRRPLSYHTDTDALSESERDKLLELVRSSGILDLQPEQIAPTTPGHPDVYHYTLSIVEEGVTHAFSFDDTRVPASVRPLLQYLQECAVKQRMQGL